MEGAPDGEVRRYGFYTHVFVSASNCGKAELKAVDLVRKDKGLREAILNSKSDPPLLFAEEFHLLKTFGRRKRMRTGFAFYPERGPRRRHGERQTCNDPDCRKRVLKKRRQRKMRKKASA